MTAGLLSFIKKAAWEECGEPVLTSLHLYTPLDRTYGRADIPFSPMEKRLHENSQVDVWFGKAMLSNGQDWCWYQVWENKFAQRPSGRRADMIFAHGTGVHSGTLASHSRRYLDAGFRLIVPDLASHGYSSGLHVYQRHMSNYTEGLHAVLHDVARRDGLGLGRLQKWQRQPTFMLGLSFGGTVALHYALDYPHSLRSDVVDQDEIPIDGIIGVGPILGYSPLNVSIPPSMAGLLRFTERYVGGSRVELVVPHKKSLDKDPKVYKSLINEDKRSHQGAFRLGHLLCIDEGVIRLQRRVGDIRHPVFIQQGGQDRVACPQKTVSWIRRVASDDKRMAIYPVCQHVIFRKAKTEEEDLAGRVACIEDGIEWMDARLYDSSSSNYRRDRSLTPVITMSYDDSYSSDAASDRSIVFDASSSSSGLSTPSTPCFSERSFTGGPPDMTEVPPSPGFATNPLDFPTRLAKGDERQQFTTMHHDADDHPLLAKAHRSTLPILAKLCPERCYRSYWPMAEALRPFDIVVANAHDAAGEQQDFSSFSST